MEEFILHSPWLEAVTNGTKQMNQNGGKSDTKKAKLEFSSLDMIRVIDNTAISGYFKVKFEDVSAF